MGHIATLQHNIFSFHSLNGLHICNKQESCILGACSALDHSLRKKTPTLHRICFGDYFSTTKYSIPWKGLRCRSFQRSVLIDRANEVDHEDWCFGSDYVGERRNSRELLDSKKSINSPTLSPEAPFVQNDEMTNNEILQRLCSRGKLTVAARLIDVMARKSQIPHFPSCTNLIRGFIRKGFVDEACKTLNKMVMSGGVPDTVTYNMVIGGLCKKVV